MKVTIGFRKLIPCMLGIFTLCLMCPHPFDAQTIAGRIEGTVQDTTQADVAKASVNATNQDTGLSTNVQTDDQGHYVLPSLPAGRYRLTVQATGFRNEVSKDIVVSVAQTTRQDFTLELGALNQTVEVTGTSPLVESTTSGLAQVIDRQQTENLPLNGRLFSQLTQLIPGSVPGGFADAPESPSGAGARSAIMATINGLSPTDSSYKIDGVYNMEPLNGFISLSPPVEAIEETNIQTSNPSAEFGSFGGSVVNLTIRSGTNDFHGSLFEFFRNDALDARTFFAATKAPLRSNQFGGAIGGPIKRNKAFFFFDYQGLRLGLGQTNSITVPTPLMRQGIFSSAEGFGTIYNPATGVAYPMNQIPVSQLDPVALKVANLYPLPNTATTYSNGPGINYVQNTTQTQNPDQIDVKGDYQISERSRLFVRESYDRRSLTSPTPGNEFIASPYGNVNSDSHNHNAAIGHTYTFSPTVLNEFRLGFNRFNTFDYGNDYGINENNLLGIPNGNIAGHPETSGIADFNIAGIQNTGSPGWTDATRLANSFEITDGLTWTAGNHTLKFGIDLLRTDATLTNPQTAPRGEFDFNSNVTSNQGAGGAAFASFLLGDPYSVERDVVNTTPDVRRYMDGFYVQDDYRVTRQLTLNLGVRFDYFSAPKERYNRQTNLDLSTGLLVSATDSNPGPNVNSFFAPAPRFGFAYSPDNGKTAIRGAFGVSNFNQAGGANGGTLERNYPWFEIYSLAAQNQFTPFTNVSKNGLPGATPVVVTPTIALPTGLDPFYVPQNFRAGEALMWNLDIQRQVMHDGTLDVAYVATRGVFLYRDRNIDTAYPGPGSADLRRPYYDILPQISAIDERSSDGNSHYDSLQVKFTKRYSNGLQALLSYTYSHDIDDLSGFWPYNDVLNRGSSSSDVRHNFVASYTYELPFGAHKRWLSSTSRPMEIVTGGWTLNGITTLRTGFPLTVTLANSLLNTGTTNRANVTCPHVPKVGSVTEWFDTGCYAAPSQLYVFGNSGIGTVTGPGLVNFDLSIFKTESLGESRKIEVRAEFFNAFNNPHFDNPNTTLGESTFGQITSTINTAREIQLGLKFSF